MFDFVLSTKVSKIPQVAKQNDKIIKILLILKPDCLFLKLPIRLFRIIVMTHPNAFYR